VIAIAVMGIVVAAIIVGLAWLTDDSGPPTSPRDRVWSPAAGQFQ
jgi:hypothetical protein